MASSKTERIFHVAVVGMSGTTDTRGDFGVGKSCLCNRFMTAHQDEYHYRHNSIIRQCDFSGKVVNNDHFLYWGNIVKRFEGIDFHFRIIEQTEFIDDMSFTTLNGGNARNYFRRCADTKLSSRGKKVYICLDQLSDEQDFPQDILPRGKFQVEGYLLLFDVSNVKSRSFTKQMEFVRNLYSAISNTRRPIVLVATKCDDIAEDMGILEIKRFAREKRLSLVECSAQNGVNVDLPFCTLASLIDRSRNRPRNITYMEGLRRREEKVNLAKQKYIQLLEAKVTDYHSVWLSTKADLEVKENYQEYVKLAGTRLAKKDFWDHTKRLKEIHQNKKLEQYLSKMREMLVDTFPDLNTINERYWPACRDALPKHPRFNEWFIDFNEPWEDSKYIDTDDVKIPFQLITDPKYSARVESYFQEHVQRLLETKKKERYKSDFRTILGTLRDTILPGSNFHEMRLYLEPSQCYKMLEEQERMAIFITHQNEILQQAKEDLLELLIERTDLFKKLNKSGNVVEEVRNLQDQLSNDQRFRRLEKLPLERYGMIVKQFAFTHNLATNSCLLHSQEKCIENQIREFGRKNPQMCDALTLNILLVGIEELADDLSEEIKEMSKEGFQLNGLSINIVTEILDQKALTTNIHQRENFDIDGCVCVFTSLQSFEYIKTTLELTKLREGEDVPKVLSHIPVTLMLGRDPSIPESDLARRDEVQGLADRIPDSTIVDYPEESVYPDKKFSQGQITSCMQTFRTMFTFRVAVVMMCGDAYSVEPTLSYLTENHTCHPNANCEFCVTMEMLIDNKRQKMEVEIVSYHQAQLNCETIHHAYILCYSPTRKASLETMKAFTSRTIGIPTLIVAVSEDSSSSTDLVQEGQEFAGKSDNIDFMQGLPNFMQHNIQESQFLIQAFRKRKETEKIHEDLFLNEYTMPSSESKLLPSVSSEDEPFHSTPDNELVSPGNISPMAKPSATGEGEDTMKKKLRKKRKSMKKKPLEMQKVEEFMHSLEQLVGQTIDEIGKSPSKQPSSGEPTTRKWWFKTRRQRGFLKGLSIEELTFRPENKVPLFVEQCVATIEHEGLTTEGIYRKPGRVAVVEDVITKIDKDPNFDITQLSINVHAVASSFKQYFHALSEPFISYKTQTDLIKKFNDWPEDDFLIHLKSCVDNLSGRKYNLLKYILLHLKRIIDHSDENKMHAYNVSICWWPCLLHPQSKSVKDLTNEAKLASIFTLLLKNVEMILGLEVAIEEEGMAKETNGQGEKMVEEEQNEVMPNEP